MPRLKTIKSLKQALKLTKGSQLTAQQLINGRIYLNGRGWSAVNVCKEFRKELAEMISDILGGRNLTKLEVKSTLIFSKPQHWGLARIFFVSSSSGEVRPRYCAGQDYTYETAQIRKALRY